jgi:hypothetical protein
VTAVDRGRAEVYAAELAAFDGTDIEAPAAFDDLVALARHVMSAPWWPCGRVQVRCARSDARSSTTRHAARPVIHLAAPQMTPATLIHELAHVLAGVDSGHGALFRRAHVDLACVAFGLDRGGWLESSYAGAGLALSSRRWPTPLNAATPTLLRPIPL